MENPQNLGVAISLGKSLDFVHACSNVYMDLGSLRFVVAELHMLKMWDVDVIQGMD